MKKVTGAQKKLHPAFATKPMDGYAIEKWKASEDLLHSEVLFALGFTSYQMLINYIRKYHNTPIEPTHEILLRLYLLEPEFPRMFTKPPITELLDFVFNLGKGHTDDDRKRCIALLAPLLGRNRGSGYRWIRNKTSSENPVSLDIAKLSAKVFSMNPAHARDYFWRATFAAASARGMNTETVRGLLAENGVKIG